VIKAFEVDLGVSCRSTESALWKRDSLDHDSWMRSRPKLRVVQTIVRAWEGRVVSAYPWSSICDWWGSLIPPRSSRPVDLDVQDREHPSSCCSVVDAMYLRQSLSGQSSLIGMTDHQPSNP